MPSEQGEKRYPRQTATPTATSAGSNLCTEAPDKALAKAVDAGGTPMGQVMVPPMDTPPGRMAQLADDTGAVGNRLSGGCGYAFAMADPMAAAAGAQPEPASTVDYRLVRSHVLHRLKSGAWLAEDVCDAHPELVRAGREVGAAAGEPCPVCEGGSLSLVSYVFGPRLPAHGRCISHTAEIAKLARRKGRFTCYEVEVCPECHWNHLLRSYVLQPC